MCCRQENECSTRGALNTLFPAGQAQAGPSSRKDRAVSALPSWKAVPGTLCPRLPPLRAVTRGHSGVFRPHGVLTAMAQEVGTLGPRSGGAGPELALGLSPLTYWEGPSPFPFCCSNVPWPPHTRGTLSSGPGVGGDTGTVDLTSLPNTGPEGPQRTEDASPGLL